jgi:ATP-dependent RNA helicase RhlE
VQDIAHVINYDLPDGAETFIHRAGRTGRAGLSGVATTLFGREQRSELMQLERTLGIQMERVRESGDAAELAVDRHRSRIPASQPIYARKAAAAHASARVETRAAMRMDRLPGEFLQAQMEN